MAQYPLQPPHRLHQQESPTRHESHGAPQVFPATPAEARAFAVLGLRRRNTSIVLAAKRHGLVRHEQ